MKFGVRGRLVEFVTPAKFGGGPCHRTGDRFQRLAQVKLPIQEGAAQTMRGREMKFGVQGGLVKCATPAKFGGGPCHKTGDRR